MELKTIIEEKGKKAKSASRALALASTEIKNRALEAMAQALITNMDLILFANEADIREAELNGMSKSMLDRLLLTPDRIAAMADGIRQIARLKDPVGEADYITRRPNGLDIAKVHVPLGVIAIIYEARPNVTADAAALCLKSGNAVILRGGKEALRSNKAICDIIATAAEKEGIAKAAIQLIESPEREGSLILMQLRDYVDVLIPRGGVGLKQSIQQNATVPYIMTGMGNCHIYVDSKADFGKALKILVNGKVQRPAVCNSVETLLVHEKIAKVFLPLAYDVLSKKGVEIRGCKRTCAILPCLKNATEDDWETEYEDLILAVKIVDTIDDAIAHINCFGTQHSEAIITEDYSASRKFMNEVDAAAVYTNASTRFTDGGEFGFGAEMGISTQKLHTRGPMGLSELTTIKYMINGNGQIRE